MGDPSPKDEEVLLSIDVPPCVGDHLVEVFFEKVQCSLPLLHRPTFIGSKLSSENRYKQLNFETALLFNGMFALSARFSDSSDLWAGDPKDRGEIFAKKAKALCNRYLGADCDREPTLRALQGRILLTYYQLTSEPCFQSWLGTGECCRMAYSLYLHQIDRDTTISAEKSGDPVQNWVDQEELRRAWWAIFQLDGFASVIAFRPFNIDQQNMDVLLPVSDDAWFSGRPTASAKLSSKGPSSTWRCLEGCENQDPYAWYLICAYLVRAAFKEFEKKEHLTEDLEILQSALQCFALNLPDQFRLSAANMRFNDNNFAEKNWVICTNILLQTAQILVVLTLKLENLSTQQPDLPSDPSSPRACQSYTEFVAECGQYINDRLRAVRLWSADYMPLASPLVACALIGPAAVHAAKRPHPGGSKDEMRSSLEAYLLDLSLHRFGKFWRLGEFLQGKRFFSNASDFDFGETRLVELSRKVHFPWVLSNVTRVTEDGDVSNEHLAGGERFVVRIVQGYKVGFIGLAGTPWRVGSVVRKPLLYTTTPLDGRCSVIRSSETNLGNMRADAYRAYYGADIALVNSGSIRCDRIIEPASSPLRVKDIIG
ncbi:hypothetical protein CDV55_107029 [Aspergillus turcosus]|nr:hypothetical protein CDV55_107029 [Aspergillus turcosus]